MTAPASTPLLCAELSNLAYGGVSWPTTEALLDGLGMTWWQPLDREGSQALLTGDGTRVIVAFRGTDELVDWLRDARYVKTPFPFGRVHKGFLHAFNKVWSAVLESLDRVNSDLPRIYTGHSLGAAMALLAASVRPPASRSGTEGRPAEVHVFGCPRVGNGDFVASLHETPVDRWESHFDPVTLVPLPTSPVQIAYSLINWRKPTLYRHAGRRRALSSWGHSMTGRLEAMRKRG